MFLIYFKALNLTPEVKVVVPLSLLLFLHSANSTYLDRPGRPSVFNIARGIVWGLTLALESSESIELIFFKDSDKSRVVFLCMTFFVK